MKNKINVILAFILGLLISGIGVYAITQINASQVTYTDGNNHEITVETALNTLYSNLGGRLGQTYSSFNFGHERLENMSTTIQNLPSGKYLCTSIFSTSTRGDQNYANSGNTSSLQVNGCSSTKNIKKSFNAYGGANSISNGYNIISKETYIFECDINNITNVTTSITSTAVNWLPWIISLDCTSIE